MDTLKKIFRWFIEIQGWIAVFLLGLALVLNTYEIFQRNVFQKSFIWLQEYSTLMLLWFAMLGTSKIVYEDQDIFVDLFIKKFPKGLRKVTNIIVDLVVILFVAVALKETWSLAASQIGHTTIIAKYPLILRSIPMIIAFFSIGVKNCANLVKHVKSFGKSDEIMEGGTV